jgi:antitoxin (DNA-binding transcriptional repressor) of toxin-antitoxin stability system
MSETTTLPADDEAAPLDLARLLRGVEEEGRAFVLTRGGRPVARLVPEHRPARRELTPEQERALAAIRAVHAAGGYPMGPVQFNRDEIYEERVPKRLREG